MKTRNRKISVEVLLLPHASNLADFDPLRGEPGLNMRFVKMGERIGDPDLFILPGTKNTLLDFQSIKKAGYANEIRRLLKKKRAILGIAGGFQMLGTKIIDIKGSEYGLPQSEGLGFFYIVTRIMPSKISCRVQFEPLAERLAARGRKGCDSYSGFEAHLGRTRYLNGAHALFKITKRDGVEVEISDGAVNEDGNVFGTYIHEIFKNDRFRKTFMGMVKDNGAS
jgi:adenosylcobyric acid synthase